MMAVVCRSARPVFAYGGRAGCLLVDGDGWHHAFDHERSHISSHSTVRRALDAIDRHTLIALYGTTVEVLLQELRRGLVALDQDVANLNRLARCDESQIREISAALLDWRWSRQDVAKLATRWRESRGEE
jgi:hypothetical protein